MIEVVNVSKTFDDGKRRVEAVKDVFLKVEKGEIYGVIGYSGAGKSTLVRCINLLEKPNKGKILFKGEDLTLLKERDLRNRRKKIGMIFQHFSLFNSRNVYQNIAYPLRGAKLSKEDERKKVLELLELVGLKDKEKSYISQLSGGQKQRVGIARALANDPEILLCDEATSALDPKTTKSILSLLKELRAKLGLTIILITHEMAVIKEICDRVSVMEDGKIVEDGTTVKLFSRPENNATREFLNLASNRSRIYETLNLKENIFNIKSGDVLARVSYLGESTGDALISRVSKKYNLDVSILYGSIEILGNTPVGEFIILFHGERACIQKSINYFREKGLIVEVLDHGRDTVKIHTKCS
ncbi:MAG: methionine ABC transporter ATP-binding protein [Tissierella sp.]|uniref:methionine ABC transporter ATP-binding protein n=1 Tax=Tissierella sp. TaxID=41274 RepID=UPI003F962846